MAFTIAAKHFIQLLDDVMKSAHSAQSRLGPTTRQFEKTELEKNVKMDCD